MCGQPVRKLFDRTSELMRIAHEEGVPIYGINYNDDPPRRGVG